MGKFVEQDEIRLADDGGDHAERGGEAGGKDKCRLGLFGFGQSLFQQSVGRQCSADQAGGGGAGTKTPDALDQRGLDLRMAGEAEVVVGREVPQFASATGHPRACR